jgi:hypothetical protein
MAMLVWSAAEMSVENFPGWQTLAPTIGTALVISAGPDATINRHLMSMPPMRWIGLISYPLYLWHWPLLAVARIAQEGSLSAWSGIAIIAAATALAWGTFRFIELPVRRGTFPFPRVATLLTAACILLAAVSLAVFLESGFPARSYAHTYNDTPPPDEALSTKACADRYQHLYAGGFIQDRDICIFSEERKKSTDTIIVGDSHALRLYEAFVELGVDGVTVIGRGSCAPILNAPNLAWLKCQPTDDRIIDFAISSSAKTLILTGVFERYFDGTYGNDISPSDIEVDIRKVFAKLSASHKQVAIIFDNPSLPFEARSCFKRPLTLERQKDCSFERSFYDDRSRSYQDSFRKYAAIYPNVTLIDPSKYFCDAQKCFAYNSAGMLYSGDNNHLNMRGAMIVARSALALLSP